MAMARESRSVPGVIETLSEGFDSINRIIWILIFPVGIDLLLWLAPRLSISQLIERLFADLMLLYAEASRSPEIDGAWLEQNQATSEQLQQLLESVNLLGFISGAVTSIPSIGPDRHLASGQIVEVSSLGSAALLLVALTLFGIFLGAVYYGLIAQQVRDGQPDWRVLPRKALRCWLSVVGFLGLLLGLSIVIGLPTTLVTGILALIAPGAGAALVQLIVFLLLLLNVWAVLYLFFLPHAIVVSEVGPIQAVKNSVRVVHQNFWAALGLVLLVIVISNGMAVIWSTLAQQTWGLAISIIGNAYVMSGLAAASMLFYRNRVNQRR